MSYSDSWGVTGGNLTTINQPIHHNYPLVIVHSSLEKKLNHVADGLFSSPAMETAILQPAFADGRGELTIIGDHE